MIGLSTQGHWTWLIGISIGLTLSGCASNAPSVSKDDGRGSYKVGRTYTVMGQTYTPHEDFSYSETGQASWYGPGFHGRSTANGEVYNQTDLTAAHRTLPMPSIVLVTNLDNGLSTMVRINDRGPFAHNRIIDLSKAAADELQMTGAGIANVRVDILRRESEMVKEVALNGGGPTEQMAALMDSQRNRSQVAAKPRSTPAPAPTSAPPSQTVAVAMPLPPATALPTAPVGVSRGGFFIQAGAFGTAVNAERARNRVAAIGDTSISPVVVNGQELYRLRIGPVGDASTADRVLSQVQRAGFADARVIVD